MTTPSLRSNKAFTLIELLTVIAIVALLVGVSSVGISAAIKSANVAQTKAKFNSWASALEAYKAEYGIYPRDFNKVTVINLNDYKNEFYKSLTGRNDNGRPLSEQDRRTYNRKALSFLEIVEGDTNEDGDFIDAFGNTEIFIKVDHDNDGFINKLPINDDGDKDDLRLRVAIYTDSDEFPKVRNWEK